MRRVVPYRLRLGARAWWGRAVRLRRHRKLARSRTGFWHTRIFLLLTAAGLLTGLAAAGPQVARYHLGNGLGLRWLKLETLLAGADLRDPKALLSSALPGVSEPRVAAVAAQGRRETGVALSSRGAMPSSGRTSPGGEDNLERSSGTGATAERVQTDSLPGKALPATGAITVSSSEPSLEVFMPGNPGRSTDTRSAPPELAYLAKVNWGKGPLVAIYHTHTSESYKTDDFNPEEPDAYHEWNSERTGIVIVGKALAQTLAARYGIPVVHSHKIFDYPVHPEAYYNSEKTVRSIVSRYPKLQMVFDIHRDAPGERDPFVTELGGTKVGQVAIVVTTALQSPLEHPNWSKNYAFAKRLSAKMEEMYPGLFRRIIRVDKARYNQHLFPTSLILEIGTYETHIRQAVRTADLLADVIASVLYEMRSADR